MGRTVQQILRLSLGLCLLVAACNKDKDNPTSGGQPGNVPPSNPGNDRYVYVACEGSYGNGNASLTMQNLTSFTQYDDVFLNTNGKALGDVLQSIERIEDRLFLCVNNSDKVYAINAETWQLEGTLDIPQPRYIMTISPEKAYVSSLYSNKLYIINPKRLTVEGTIELPAKNPERMAMLGNRVYVCPWDTATNKVFIVDKLSDQVTDSYTVAGRAPHSVVIDGFGFVWVLSGNVEQGKWAALTKLAPGSNDIVEQFQFEPLRDPIKMTKDAAGTTLYFIGVDYNGNSGYNGIYSMGVQDGKLPATPLIPAQKFQYYWGLGVDPVTDEIYVGDPKGFIQRGSVSVYSKSGQQRRTFEVGVGPSYFYFE